MTSASVEDVRILVVRVRARRLQGLRAESSHGSTVRVRLVAEHQALPHGVMNLNLSFVVGRLVAADIGDGEPPDVSASCDYSALFDYLTGGLSVTEGQGTNRFKLSGTEDMFGFAVNELDDEVSRSALEELEREHVAVRMELLRSGKAAEPLMDPDLELDPNLSPAGEKCLRLVYEEWSYRTSA